MADIDMNQQQRYQDRMRKCDQMDQPIPTTTTMNWNSLMMLYVCLLLLVMMMMIFEWATCTGDRISRSCLVANPPITYNTLPLVYDIADRRHGLAGSIAIMRHIDRERYIFDGCIGNDRMHHGMCTSAIANPCETGIFRYSPCTPYWLARHLLCYRCYNHYYHNDGNDGDAPARTRCAMTIAVGHRWPNWYLRAAAALLLTQE